MRDLINKLKRLAKLVRAVLPSKLPQGISDFNSWSDEILDLYNMPNNDSLKFALAVMITHLPPTVAYKPKYYFGLSLMKGASTQVAFAIMDEMKQKQKKAQEAKLAEVTAPAVTPNETL